LVANADNQLPTAGEPDKVASRPLLGDFLALASALCYATYVSLLKKQIGQESRIDMKLFFGYVGLANIVLAWPLIIILNWADVEPFAPPRTRKEWVGVLANVCFST
jgi:solute carrier family 35, member F5